MEASTEMAVTCEVDAPSAMAFWKRVRSSCHWAVLAGRGDNRNDAKLLPELGNGAQNCAFSDFAAQGMLQRRDGGVARLKQLVGLDGQLRNLAGAGKLRAAAPVAIAAKRVHVGQNPCRHNKVGLLAGLSQQVQAHCHAVCLQAYQQLLGKRDVFGVGGRIPLTRNGLNKGRRDGGGELPSGQEETQAGLLNPVRASSRVRAPCPFRRILSARDASNCSAVKEKPHFQAGDQAFFRNTAGSPEFLYRLGFLKVTSGRLFGLYPGWLIRNATRRAPLRS